MLQYRNPYAIIEYIIMLCGFVRSWGLYNEGFQILIYHTKNNTEFT